MGGDQGRARGRHRHDRRVQNHQRQDDHDRGGDVEVARARNLERPVLPEDPPPEGTPPMLNAVPARAEEEAKDVAEIYLALGQRGPIALVQMDLALAVRSVKLQLDALQALSADLDGADLRRRQLLRVRPLAESELLDDRVESFERDLLAHAVGDEDGELPRPSGRRCGSRDLRGKPLGGRASWPPRAQGRDELVRRGDGHDSSEEKKSHTENVQILRASRVVRHLRRPGLLAT
jgi:hypothetical protein